jgi:Chaperone for flagella basal body P-ring formation
MNFSREMARCAIVTAMLAVAGFANAAERAALAPWMVARPGKITGCDLLPASGALDVRDRTAGYLADEPRFPCAQRAALHLELQHSLRNSPQLNAAVAVPSEAELTRPSRTLSRAEILAALAASASVNQFSGLQSLHLEDIISAPAILVAEEKPILEITRLEPDLSGTVTRARLWIPSEPRIPPFWITLRRAMVTQPTAPANGAVLRTVALDIPPANAAAKAPPNAGLGQTVLIVKGKPVQVLMQATGIRIVASGTALEAGREGQKIRVRSEYAGKVLVGTVLNAQTVRLEY